MDTPSGFASLGLRPALLDALTGLGYEEPTPIQSSAIPSLLAGRDLLGQAATGTGKTAAFALPLIERVTRDGKTRALVLVPTRELAMQVAEAVHRYGRALGTSVLAVYGGASMFAQVKSLSRGTTVVVATPGRALDHLRRGTLKLDALEMLVLDEADEMLDMGFAEDLEAILAATPAARQTALFSATIPARIAALAKKWLRDPVRIEIAREVLKAGSVPKVRQVAYIVPRVHKLAALGRVLDMEAPTAAIVFCRTRTEVDELTQTLIGRGWRAEALHGGLSQEQRDRVMKKFRGGLTDLLVATDVAARGLDVEHVTHVVNYDVPSAPEAYIHRIGRTGRAGREGAAITLVEPREHRLLRNVEALMRQKIEVATVPTVADMRSHKLELVRAQLREAILGGGLDSVRGVVESLAQEYDVMDVAAAAVKLMQEAEGGGAGGDEQEIPAIKPATRPVFESRARPGVDRPPQRFGERPSAEPTHGAKPFGKAAATGGPRGAAVGGSPPAFAKGKSPRSAPGLRAPAWEAARLWIGAGREAGVRPADLVGAITNEANVTSAEIGAIRIADRYALVEVPEALAGRIVTALRSTTIKGRKVVVRRDRDKSGE